MDDAVRTWHPSSINSSPNVIVNTGPFVEQPWLYPGYPVFGIGGWAVP